jgi:hypothetical protein
LSRTYLGRGERGPVSELSRLGAATDSVTEAAAVAETNMATAATPAARGRSRVRVFIVSPRSS